VARDERGKSSLIALMDVAFQKYGIRSPARQLTEELRDRGGHVGSPRGSVGTL